MIRTLNVLALLAVIGSAVAAYSVKYETILIAEKLRKRETELGRERDAIALLKAEWQLLNRPARLQTLASPEPGVHTLNARQIARVSDIPRAKSKDQDTIGSLLTGSLPLPAQPKSASASATGAPAKKAAVRPGAKPTVAKAGLMQKGVAAPKTSLPNASLPKANAPLNLAARPAVPEPKKSSAPKPLSQSSSAPASAIPRPPGAVPQSGRTPPAKSNAAPLSLSGPKPGPQR